VFEQSHTAIVADCVQVDENWHGAGRDVQDVMSGWVKQTHGTTEHTTRSAYTKEHATLTTASTTSYTVHMLSYDVPTEQLRPQGLLDGHWQ